MHGGECPTPTSRYPGDCSPNFILITIQCKWHLRAIKERSQSFNVQLQRMPAKCMNMNMLYIFIWAPDGGFRPFAQVQERDAMSQNGNRRPNASVITAMLVRILPPPYARSRARLEVKPSPPATRRSTRAACSANRQTENRPPTIRPG